MSNRPTVTCAACTTADQRPLFRKSRERLSARAARRRSERKYLGTHRERCSRARVRSAGALVGLALYVISAVTPGLIIGWVSLAVGFIVGKAMRMGSRGVGGRRHQVAAALLTYFAVSMSAVPIAIEQVHSQLIVSSKTVAELAITSIASPILDLRDPVHGIIGLIILFVGIRFAWRFTAAPALNVSGPYRRRPLGPPEVDGIWLPSRT